MRRIGKFVLKMVQDLDMGYHLKYKDLYRKIQAKKDSEGVVAKKRRITIDGKEFSFREGETILQVAQRNGVDIPTLCHMKGASPAAARRMSIVEVQGA